MTAPMTPSTLRALAEETTNKALAAFAQTKAHRHAAVASIIESALKRAALAEEGAAMFQGEREDVLRSCEVYMKQHDSGPALFRVVISEVKG